MGAITSVITRIKDVICCTGADGNTALHLPVLESKDVTHVKTLIDADTSNDINTKNSDGNTALHLCLLNTNRFVLATLDDKCASERNVQPLQPYTVTVNATLLEDYDIAETLIDEGADLKIQNNDGNTPLHLALINSKPSKLVHESNDNKDHLDKQCPEDVKVYKLASQQSNVHKLVKKMIDKGADVGKQNNEGNTALHLALSSQLQLAEAVYEIFDSYVDVMEFNYYEEKEEEENCLKIVDDNYKKLLQILLGNSETIYTCNSLGMDPIQMTIDSIKRKCMTILSFNRHHYSLQKISGLMTIVPLLNLEYHEHFSYSNCHGNSLLHLLMESFQYMYNPSIILILRSVDPTYLKFNVQNKAGNTPLHIARVEDVVYILSYCDKVDRFARNKRKETFLHTMFRFNHFDYLYNDIKQILQGQCKYCSKEDVKQLLHCRDIAGNTPLHVLLTNAKDISWSDLIKLFYEAGADLNACNTSKESILHCLVRTYDSEESIKFAIEHGADLNVQNVFGESPIFVAKERVVKFLIDSGADLNVCNKSGQNLFLSRMYNIRPILYLSDIEYLIQNCSVKVKDIHGNNILHYVAWHGMYKYGEESCDDVNMLLDAGAEIEPDSLGQLPCYIAHQMGHVKLARKLCKCENSKHLDEFTFTEQILNLNIYKTLKSIEQDISPFFTYNMKYFACHTITDILERPFIGSVRFEGEAEEIGSCIVNIINEICKRLGHGNDLLENKVIQSGSVGENTKVGLLDEFDFMCVFSILSEACCVVTVSKEEPSYATVKLKDEFRGHRYRSLFNEYCSLRCGTVIDIFMTELRDIVQCLDIYSHPNIIYKNIIHEYGSPNVKLYFVWTGRKYKGMEIKVDLVPAMQIKGWWPPGTRLDSLACDTEQIEQLRKDGAVLLFREIHRTMCQISVFAAEKIHLAGLSREARNAYKVAKILCDKRICPRESMYSTTNITSYMLKNCMFHVLDNPIESVYDCVCKIFRYLIECTKNKRLLPYSYPHYNMFKNRRKEDIIKIRFYSQIILKMIGSTEESTDIDELIYEYEYNMYSLNSDSEDSEAEDTEDQYTEYNQ